MYNSSFSIQSSMKNSFLSEMTSRGFLNQCTDLDKLEEVSSKKSIAAYIGFDCTAPSLHVGSLMQIMVLRLLQRYGHQPIVLLCRRDNSHRWLCGHRSSLEIQHRLELG